MKISYKWLKEYIVEPLPPINKLVDNLTMHSFEIESVEEQGDDKILDVKVLPNRAHDCLCHYGVALEAAALTGLTPRWTLPHQPFSPFDGIELNIDTKKCKRAVMVHIKDLKVGRSPAWLKEKIAIYGLKSINSVVDLTNYLMYAYGQPMHAFDAEKISKNASGQFEITIRNAEPGEKITLLNKKEYALDPSMTVIADSKNALDVAGVMGGLSSGVTTSTKEIILSLSNFNAVSIRKTAKALGIRTDASTRFENEISESLIDRSLPFALKMISEIAKGKFVGGVDINQDPQKEIIVPTSVSQINNILGLDLKREAIVGILGKQRLISDKKGDDLEIKIPPERLDLTIPEDIAEEVGRLYGFDQIQSSELNVLQTVMVNRENYFSYFLRELLIKQGFSEVYTYGFTDSGEVEIENPLASDKKFVRADLREGMEASLVFNFKYIDFLGLKEIKIFEIGKVFKKSGEVLHLSLGTKFPKSKNKHQDDEEVARIIRLIDETFGAPLKGISIVGGVAEIDFQKIISETKLKPDLKNLPKSETKKIDYKPISPYPFAIRDVAVFVPKETSKSQIKTIIEKHLTSIVHSFSLFDVFEKEDKTSYAWRLVFQSQEKTLTDEEINSVMDSIYEDLKSQKDFEIR